MNGDVGVFGGNCFDFGVGDVKHDGDVGVIGFAVVPPFYGEFAVCDDAS